MPGAPPPNAIPRGARASLGEGGGHVLLPAGRRLHGHSAETTEQTRGLFCDCSPCGHPAALGGSALLWGCSHCFGAVAGYPGPRTPWPHRDGAAITSGTLACGNTGPLVLRLLSGSRDPSISAEGPTLMGRGASGCSTVCTKQSICRPREALGRGSAYPGRTAANWITGAQHYPACALSSQLLWGEDREIPRKVPLCT